MHAQAGEERARGGQRERAEAHAGRDHVADGGKAHEPDAGDDRHEEVLGLLRARDRRGNQHRRAHHREQRLEQRIAQVTELVGVVDDVFLVEVRVDLADVARADEARDDDRHDEKPHQRFRQEALELVAAQQVRDERRREHHVDGVEAGEPEHAVREEITTPHRQHDHEQHRADAVVGERRKAGEHGNGGDERVELADRQADAANNAEQAEADGRGSEPRAALRRQPGAYRSHVMTSRRA